MARIKHERPSQPKAGRRSTTDKTTKTTNKRIIGIFAAILILVVAIVGGNLVHQQKEQTELTKASIYLDQSRKDAQQPAQDTSADTTTSSDENASTDDISIGDLVLGLFGGGDTEEASGRKVYITGGGRSDVYWYSKSNMPSSTNMRNIITMTEQEALAAGKRHSYTE
jgi:DNA-entry nuclease